MKLAIIGSRNIKVIDIDRSITEKPDEIVSGGTIGVDTCASEFARKNGLKLTEFLPDYNKYGNAAPIVRNKQIVDYADKILIFWDGSSKGTLSVIKYSKKTNKPHEIIIN